MRNFQRALRLDYDEKTDTLTVVMKNNPENNCHYDENETRAIRLAPDNTVSAVFVYNFLKRLEVEVVDRKRNVYRRKI